VSAESPPEPTWTLALLPDYFVELAVWRPGIGPLAAEELEALGVSRPLIKGLRAWTAGWEAHALANDRDPHAFAVGQPMSVRLARQLQAELPEFRIFLTSGPDPRPVKEWPA
jgi:hypothetical protein